MKTYYSKISKNSDCFLVKIIDKYDNLFDLKKNKSNIIKKNYILEIETFIKPHLFKTGSFQNSFLDNLNYNKKTIYV